MNFAVAEMSALLMMMSPPICEFAVEAVVLAVLFGG